MGTEVYTNVWQMIIMTRNTAYKLYDNSRICVTRMGTEVYTNVWHDNNDTKYSRTNYMTTPEYV